MGKGGLTAPARVHRDHTGETIAGWTLLERLDRLGVGHYRARHACGFVRNLTLAYLRSIDGSGAGFCSACVRHGRKGPEDRAVKVGAVFGTRRVTRQITDGASKYARTWGYECIRCGAVGTCAEDALFSSRATNAKACRYCKGKLAVGVPQADRGIVQWVEADGAIDIGIRTRDGRLFLGTLKEVTV